MTTDAGQIELVVRPSSTRVSPEQREKMLACPGFGRVFTDHMVTISWDTHRGWHNGQLIPYGPISLDPAAAVFHYSQQVFEGLKVYRQVDGSVVAFRPLSNAARFNRSLTRCWGVSESWFYKRRQGNCSTQGATPAAAAG